MFGKRLLTILLIILITISAFSNVKVSALAPLPEDITTAYHPLTGMARFMGAPATGRPIQEATASDKNSTDEEVARTFLTIVGSNFGIVDARNDLKILRQTQTELGTSTVRFQQTYQGIPVLAGEIIVQMDSGKNILSAGGEILPDISINTTPDINETTAIQIALTATAKDNGVGVEDLQASTPELWVYNPALLTPYKGETILGWRIEVTPKTELLPIRQLVLVEAQRGVIALSFNQISHGKNRLTYDAGGAYIQPGTLVCDESNPTCSGGSGDAIQAHVFAGQTYDFFMANHARDSINGQGMAIISTVNYGINYENAFWNGIQMTYGLGWTSDDIVAHELTHGVTEYESGLFYYYQSGAINESFSDVWGEFVDLGNGFGTDTPTARWQIGEDLPVSIGILRDMSDPTLYSNPDKMTSPYYYTGTGDNGGVHYNSGINNKAAFLMVDGGTFNSKTISPLGITKVAKIYYYAQANLLVSGSDYADLYYALQASCMMQIGSAGITAADCQEVLDALDAVEMNLQPLPEFNTNANACDIAGEYPSNSFSFFDNMDSGSGKWISGALTGTNRWSYGSLYGTFAHSGQGFFYADDYPATFTDTFLRMTNSVTVPPNGKMLFHHAYDLEPSWDGGVIEYSINGGSSWIDAGSLIDSNGYDATLSVSGNPLANRQAFNGVSHGYISTRLDLSSLAGQNVMFRFRMGLDGSVVRFGWWVDDVQIYTCVPKEQVDVRIGQALNGSYFLAPTESQRVNYLGVDSGPVVVEATDGTTDIIAALRDAYYVGGQVESFVQLMGLPQESLSTTYYFPAYNNVTLDGQLRFGNVGNSATTVTVTIAGVVRGTYPLNPGEAKRVNYIGLDSGPVVVSSSGGIPIIAALRDAYFVDGRLESFAQLMGLPAENLSTKYYFPAYNNVTLDGQLRIGNVGNSATTVTVTIAGVVRGTYPLNPSQAVRINYAGLDAGPVVVESSGGIPIIAALRDAYFVDGKLVSFVQLMGLPQEQLSTNYNFPAYNNVTLDGQLRFGNVGNSATTVTVTIGGIVRGTYPLNPSEAKRVNYAGLDAGPVVVSSSGGIPIIAALRDAYFVNGKIESFAQLMGLPLELLSSGYYFPAYNNVTLNGQLRFGIP
ncbi:MAG: M4 family metallopeptidase [Anaerolineae bacterium]|nr:M4 family metallopeptidase [Anaerolineae bacterium]